MNFDENLLDLAEQVLNHCRKGNDRLSTAESCTGGLVVGILTEIAGSSDVIDRGFVTYSNEAKSKMLGVPMDSINKYGAVSKQVATEMALGALKNSNATIAVSITGVAGPGGGTVEKPVGLVHFAIASRNNQLEHAEKNFGNQSRSSIRTASVYQALEMVLNLISNK